uniref:Importin subunit beta-1/Transportin-1-like TPR repeats domain-containing protein n=1 Tax=Entomoneis paludosa TaxID=265537 RepID=A0A7S2YBI1_9STRA
MALPDVMPRVFAAAQDPAPQVRECACFCLGQISEHCQPDILHYSSQILPIVFGLLDDNNVAVQATSCYVLEMFCERLEPEAVRPVLDSLVRKLAHMLEVSNKRSVQEMAVAALAATAVAAEEEFTPYVQGVANLMTSLIQLQDPNLFSLRGRALECMGHMAIAVGRETFRPYFAPTMQSAMEGLSTESTDLQEFAYAVFANLAKVMKEEFAPALPDLVPHLIKIIEMDEGQIEEAPESKEDGLAGLDDSDDEDENGQYVLHVRTALLEVKKGAITALGEMAAHTGTNFCPHLEGCMTVLQKAAGNWHPLIKAEAADALPSLIVPSIAAYHNGELKWTKADLTGANPLSQHTAALVQAVLTEEIALMKDEDKTTVGKACEAVQSVIELCGPHALVPVLNDALSNAHDLLAKSAPCQTADELYGEYGDDDDDHDVFMQAACDLVGGYCRVMGQHFAQYLPQFLPAICEYAKPSRPASDRSMAVGCLSEVAQELEGAISEHWQSVFLPAILNGLADEDVNVKRNSAFCAGICSENLKVQVVGDYPAMLQLLGQNFALDASASESTSACVDNSAAAVARMIMASPENVPIPQVFPVFLQALPLKIDMTENQTVYQCLLGLLQMNHPEAVSRKDEIKRILTEATHESSKVDDETKGKLLQALQGLQ